MASQSKLVLKPIRKALVQVCAVSLTMLAIATNAWAYSYSIVFSGAGPLAGTYQFGPPITGYPAITSKWNQPRDCSSNCTNPHQGADVTANYGTRVDAVCDGMIISQSAAAYELVLLCDTNGNRQADDDLRVKYDHLSKVNIYPTNTYVTKSTKIAESGDEGGLYQYPHLHFGAMANRGDGNIVWIRNEPYYRATSNWNYGNDLDFVSLPRWNGGNTAVVRTYVMSDGSKQQLNYGDVLIFHRRDGTSTWSSDVMAKSSDDFSFNLGTRYSTGVAVNWMVRATRSNISSSYRVGFFVPKYAQPSEDPNSVAYKYDYYRCTIGGSCGEIRTTP